ncbi:MAG: hypothetical protein NT006_00440 [Candidatus Aminicenantes bacterium]|nr:hypothetical protein [Candidatus Aminicenantes bacterium]
MAGGCVRREEAISYPFSVSHDLGRTSIPECSSDWEVGETLKKNLLVLWPVLSVLVSSHLGFSQTTVNPALSFIGDMRLSGFRHAPAAVGENKMIFDFHELEITAGAALNPYSRADVTLGISHGGIDIEEAYATLLRGLPLNLQVKAGQYRVDFGKLNTQHTHQWSWVERPLMFQRFFGEEGLDAAGLNISSLASLGSWALTLSGNVFSGGSYWGNSQDPKLGNLAESARTSLFAPLTDHANLEFGFSGLTTRLGDSAGGRTTMGNLDFKYKWRPDMYSSVVLLAEGMIGSRLVAAGNEGAGEATRITATGFFASLDIQFHKQYDAGALMDYCRDPVPGFGRQTGIGVFVGFSLVEETYRIGLLLRQDQGPALPRPYQTVILQLLWSLGPHKPHQF